MLKYNLDIEEGSLWLRTTPTDFALKQPFFCTEAGIFYARGEFNTVRDTKDSYLLFLTIAGSGIIRQNNVTVKLMPGQALFMNCRTPQSYYTDPAADIWTHYWIHLDGSGIRGMEDLLIPDKKITALDAGKSSLQAECDKLLSCLENTSADTVLSISLSLHTILHDLISLNSASRSRNQILIQKAADHIRSHYDSPVSIDTLLELSGMSKSYFMRQFRRYTGTTPYNYVLSLRMTKAREYLEVTDMTVHEIAMATGFSDDASFSTRFSAIVGTSPLKYRQSAITRQQART